MVEIMGEIMGGTMGDIIGEKLENIGRTMGESRLNLNNPNNKLSQIKQNPR